MSFCIERNMVQNKHGIEIFYATFKDACDKEFDADNNHGMLDTTKFHYAMLQLARILHSGEENPFDAMFQKILSADERTGRDFKCKLFIINSLTNEVIGGRLPRQDPETNLITCDIYSLDAVQINICYLD